MAKRQRWTKELVIQEIKKLHEAGEDLSASSVDSKLYQASLKRFSSWEEALELAGVDPKKVIKVKANYKSSRKKWTNELVIEEIQALYNSGEDLSAGSVSKSHKGLYLASQKRFGSWDEALMLAGIDPLTVRKIGGKPKKKSKRKWTEKRVLGTLNSMHKKGADLSYRKVQQKNNSLFNACVKYFGSYKEAIETAGIDYTEVSRLQEWTPEKVIEELRELYSQNADMRYVTMQTKHIRLLGACIKYFGSYKKAIETAGIDYSKIIDSKELRFMGSELEGILEELLTELGCQFETQKRYSLEGRAFIKPDFTLLSCPPEVAKELGLTGSEEVVFIDSKLSRWSHFSCDTVEKYSPYCDKMVLLYLRGIDNPERLNEKVSNICIMDLLPLIQDKDKFIYFSDKLLSLYWDTETLKATS